MLPLDLCSSLPASTNVDSFTEFQGSTDIHQQSRRIWPEVRAPEQ